MLVQFSGAGGTGKTTTLKLLMETEFAKGLDLQTIDSAARLVSKEWGLKDEDAQNALSNLEAVQFQNQVTDTFIGTVNALVEEGANVITERSMIDHLAYTILKMSNRTLTMTPDERELATDLIRVMGDRAEKELQRVDMLFFFPHGVFKPPTEEFRTQDEILRIAADTTMRGLIWRFKSNFPLPLGEMNVLDPATRSHHIATLGQRLLDERAGIVDPKSPLIINPPNQPTVQ